MSAERPLQIVALILILGLGWILWPVAAVVLIGGYVVLIAERPFARLLRSLRGRRALAAAIATAFVTLLLFVPFGAIGWLAIREALEAGPALDELVHRAAALRGLLGHLPPALRDALPGLTVTEHWTRHGEFLTVVTVYYLFEEGPKFVRLARRLVPLRPEQTEALFDEVQQVALGLFRGSLLTVAFHGATAALGYWIFGVRPVALL